LISHALHLNLDDAWPNEPFALPVVDARDWGPQLRFSAPPPLIAEFYREHETHLAAPFMLYGSGDFHYLTALRLRRVAGPVIVVSFDNHPDWDVRPPRWGCGGWVNRALTCAASPFGVAATLNAGGPINFSVIGAPNAQAFLKFIPGPTIVP
jgi:hypothetical protein